MRGRERQRGAVRVQGPGAAATAVFIANHVPISPLLQHPRGGDSTTVPVPDHPLHEGIFPISNINLPATT